MVENIKFCKSFGAAGRSEAEKFVKKFKDFSQIESAPEAIWRSTRGRYSRIWAVAPGKLLCGEIPGTFWADATRTIAEHYEHEERKI